MAQVVLPIAHVQSIDFGSSSSIYLSDLEPDQLKWTPFLQVKELDEELRQLFRPRRDRTFRGSKLRLKMTDGPSQEYNKGLSMHSRTELVYRLAGEYRQFAAFAGLEPTLADSGSVTLVISADGAERWRREITANADAIPIDLDVTGVNWLTLLVDYGQQGDVADQLNLCDARLVK